MKSKERKSNSEPSADSGLDLETKFFSRSAQRRVATEAMKDIGGETLKVLNELKNKIGTLSDIPQ
jgi:hypothetical protein